MTVCGLQYRYEVRHLHQEMWDSITVAIHVMHIVQLETSCVPDRFFFPTGISSCCTCWFPTSSFVMLFVP